MAISIVDASINHLIMRTRVSVFPFPVPPRYNYVKKVFRNNSLLNVNKSSLKRVSMSAMMLGAGIYIFYDHNTAHCAGNTNSSKSAANISSSSGSNDKNNDKDNNNDAVQAFLKQYGPHLGQLGFGGCLGFCSGMAFKKLGREVAVIIGLGFATLQSLSYLGYIDIDYNKLKNDAIKSLDQDGDNDFDYMDLLHIWKRVKAVLLYNLPSSGGFTTGFMLGTYYA